MNRNSQFIDFLYLSLKLPDKQREITGPRTPSIGFYLDFAALSE